MRMSPSHVMRGSVTITCCDTSIRVATGFRGGGSGAYAHTVRCTGAGSGETVQKCGEISVVGWPASALPITSTVLEAQPPEVAGSSTRTMSRGSGIMERSDLGTRQRKRRQQPSAVEATRVGSRDGARSSSRSNTATTASSCWTIMQGRGQCPPAYKPPYMDVQTVKTNLTVDQAAVLEGQSHCLLLVEPVLLPDLGHAGVTREALPGDRPLFYPNGCKNRGLGAMVRNSLYHSASAPRLTAESSSSKTFERRQQQTTTPSDWPARRGSLSSRGSSFGESRSETPISAIPATSVIPVGQRGSLSSSPDVWENPRVVDAEGGRRKPGAAKTLSRDAADKRPTAKQGGRGGQRGGGAAPKGVLAARAAGATRARHQEEQQQQQQHQQHQHQHQPLQRSKSTDLPPADPKHSDCFNYYDGADPYPTVGLDAAGRDSEWAAERRAADAEARELLSTLKRNSSRLWFLVGGGV